MSNTLEPADIRTGAAYEAARATVRREVAELKRHRRVHLGPLLALVFENRETIRSTLEEVLRTERLADPDVVAAEIDAFNAIVPAEGELAATLFLEVDDPADLVELSERLSGVAQTVYLELIGRRVPAVAEEVLIPDEPAAHYLRFHLDAEQCRAWRSGAEVTAGSDHPACRVAISLDPDQRAALGGDLPA